MLPNLTDDQYSHVIATLTPTPQAPQANAASATEYATGLLPIAPNRWILDSGATHHIISSPTSLINVKHPSVAPVSLPSGDSAGITMTGSI